MTIDKIQVLFLKNEEVLWTVVGVTDNMTCDFIFFSEENTIYCSRTTGIRTYEILFSNYEQIHFFTKDQHNRNVLPSECHFWEFSTKTISDTRI